MKKIYILSILLVSSTIMYGQLLFNEVLYDPSNSALDGDSNGDGFYSQSEDEFLEIYNLSNTNADVSGYQIWDDTSSSTAVYIIPNGTLIPPRGVLVIFGGSTPVGNFGGAVVLADTNGLSLNNSGEVIALRDNNGHTVLTFDSDALSNNPNESYTRNLDITGVFEQHNDNTPLLFSPGTKIDGTSFDTNIVVTSIIVQGNGGADSIKVDNGTLQMSSMVSPASANDKTVTWSISSGSSNATISSNGLVTALLNGTITVIATSNDTLGTSDSTTITIINQTVTGITENTNDSDFSIYPNPSSEVIKIKAEDKIDLIEVYNLNGQIVKSENAPTNEINIENLKSGTYLLKLTIDSKVASTRFIKK